MSIAIDPQKCVGCTRCTEVCPGTLLRMCGGKASIRYPEECWGCVSCVKECAAGAISLYLGADIGGMGSRMTVQKQGALLHWKVRRPDGTTQTITVDSRDSNQY